MPLPSVNANPFRQLVNLIGTAARLSSPFLVLSASPTQHGPPQAHRKGDGASHGRAVSLHQYFLSLAGTLILTLSDAVCRASAPSRTRTICATSMWRSMARQGLRTRVRGLLPARHQPRLPVSSLTSLRAGGIFKLELFLPEDYPMTPPKIRFLTKIFHPNIDKLGRICLDVLKSNIFDVFLG